MAKNNKTAVCFIRVSTQSQDLEQQNNAVMNEIKKDGYKNIITISNKESAVKLDEEHRQGLTELKQAITDNKNIDCVYIYELSRLSRIPKVLYSIRDFLIEHKVNLVCLTPYMKLLDADNKLTNTASIMFGIFGSLAEQEGYIRKERLKRGKAKAKAEGKWLGGAIPFGYDKKDHRLIVGKNAGIVQRIFQTYVQPQHSAGTIADELRAEGILNQSNKYYSTVYILRILKNANYLGNNIYPQIISEELFNKAQQKMYRFHTNVRYTETSKNYLSKRIYKSFNGNYTYASNTPLKRYEVKISKHSIKIAFADMFSWMATKAFNDKHHVNQDARIRIYKQIQILKRKEIAAENELENEKKKLERIEERYIDGKITKAKAEELEKKVYDNIYNIKQQIKEYYNAIETNKDLYESSKDINYDDLSVEDKIDLVHRTIKEIRVEQTGVKYNLIFHVYYINGETEHYKVNTHTKKIESI